jgi:hypothetical protein
MAAVTVVKVRHVTPVGYEYIVRAEVDGAVAAGDQLVHAGTIGASGHPIYSKAATNAVSAHGMALEDATVAGQVIDLGIVGEADGFSGMTPGAGLYPSGSTAGKLDTTATTYYAAATTPAVAVPARPQVRARTTTRVLYNYLP